MKSQFVSSALIAASLVTVGEAKAQTANPINILPSVPAELNPDAGGTSKATPEQAAAFAWQEFIALNWPAGPQEGKTGQREAPSSQYRFGDPTYTGPLVWETFRGKIEIFPGTPAPSTPPGYPGVAGDTSFGYDALPEYQYANPVPAADPSQAKDPVPWINLDETDEILLCNMYAGVVKPGSTLGNSSPQLIRFLAKANRVQYKYVSGPDTNWWHIIPKKVRDATTAFLVQNQASPTAGSTDMVSLPFGTIEIKAGWRPLNPSEIQSGRFHTQKVRFYETGADGQTIVYRDAEWGLVALHIIQKTPTAPFFIYATFEQADNILTADGKPVEDENGTIIQRPPPGIATSPQVALMDPRPPSSPPTPTGEETSAAGSVFLSDDPATRKQAANPMYCGAPGARLYYLNSDKYNTAPNAGNICIEKRANAIPDTVIAANTRAHEAMRKAGLKGAPWLYYKLVNVQYFPYDKVIGEVTPNGSLYDGKPPFTAEHPSPSSYYQANIVVETNRSLQLFSGGLSPSICTDWNKDGNPHKNTYYAGHAYNMGGCMGCHGSQGQQALGDFSVILARGGVRNTAPEAPALATSQGMTPVVRNRSLENK